MPSAPEVRLVVLLTCTKCGGEQLYEDEYGDLCACPRCEGGWEAASVPASLLLSAHWPQNTPAENYAGVADHILANPRTNHSLLARAGVDLPPHKLAQVRNNHSALLKKEDTDSNNVEQMPTL